MITRSLLLNRMKRNGQKKAITVTWKNRSDVNGYQIQYGTDKKFKNAVTIQYMKASKTNCTIKNLLSKKKYYVRIRAYKTINGKKQYSAWSVKKTVTIKK